MEPETNESNPAETKPGFLPEQIKEMLKEATRLRAVRIDTDIKKREELIAHSKELGGKLSELDETIGQFESDFARDRHLDQVQIDLLEQLKQGRAATRQALVDTEGQIDTISGIPGHFDEKPGKPEVMTKVQEEAEKVQETKEQFNEAIKKIDQIKDLLVKAQQLYDEATKTAAVAAEKNGAAWVILSKAKKEAKSRDLQRALDFGFNQDAAERLSEIRKSLGMFSGRDKAIVDQILKEALPIHQESESLNVSYRNAWNEAGEMRKQAELLREAIMMVFYQSDPAERKKFQDIYMTKIGRECHQHID